MNSIDECHQNHEPEEAKEFLSILRSQHFMAHHGIQRALRSVLCIRASSRRTIVKARNYITDMFPNIVISESVVRNTMAKMRFNEDNASKCISILRSQRRSGSVESLKVGLYDITGVLYFAV